jgi:hypothetical protein
VRIPQSSSVGKLGKFKDMGELTIDRTGFKFKELQYGDAGWI